MTILKNLVKSTAHAIGLELRRFSPATSEVAQLKAMFAAQSVDLVLDVGANVGQYGYALRRHVGYRGRIVSFEPMRAAHSDLTKAASRDSLWDVAPRAAIGAEDGFTTINVASNSHSSSILPMLESHESAFPDSKYNATEDVPLRRLDSIAKDYVAGASVPFLKIDTQGYEREVLKGATGILGRVVGVQLELSLVPLYQGQALMQELIDLMVAAGFDLWGISTVAVEPQTGQLLQADATFFRHR